MGFKRIDVFFLSVTIFMLSIGLLLASPAWAQEPSFGKVEDILGGRRKLLAADDLVAPFTVGSRFENQRMLTDDLKLTDRINREVVDVQCSSLRYLTQMGRLFNLPTDVIVTAAPLTTAHGSCQGAMGIYVQNPATPAEKSTFDIGLDLLPLQMVLGDFDRDGYDEVFTVGISGPVSRPMVVLRVYDAVNVNDPSLGLKLVASHTLPGVATPPQGEATVGDLNGDGNLEVAWAEADTVDPKPSQITFDVRIVTVCAANASRGGCVGQAPFTILDAALLPVDVELIPGFARFEFIERIVLTSGEYDGLPDPETGLRDEELLVVAVPTLVTSGFSFKEALIPLVYDFDENLKGTPGPNNNQKATTVTGPLWAAADSGKLKWFDDAEQVVVAGTNSSATELLLQFITFGADLSMTLPPFRVGAQNLNLPIVTGVKMGRFNPPLKEEADFNLQVAVLSSKTDDVSFVRIFEVDTSNFTITQASETQVSNKGAGNVFKYGLAVGDLQGRSLVLGPPEIVRVSNHSQPSVILGMPPAHVDWITPVGKSNPEEFNFSVVPEQYHASYQTEITQQNQSSRKGTTSYAFSTKKSVQGSVTLGVPKIAQVKASFKLAVKQSHSNFVAKKFNTYKTEEFDVSVQTLYGDQVWFTSSTFNAYYYPVIGFTVCPEEKPDCEASEELPLYAQFSGPDRIVRTEINGATLEWFQPMHEPGNVLSYPWDLAQLKLRQPRISLYTSENPTEWATDSSVREAQANWTEGGGSNVTSGQTSTHSFKGSASVSGQATFKVVGVSGKVTISKSKSKSLSTLNSQTQELGSSTGVGVTKDAVFKTPNLYQYSAQTFIFGQSAPTGTLQEIALDTKLQGPGQLQTAYTADPTLNGGAWWEIGYPRPDVALNHPARFGFRSTNEQFPMFPPNCLAVSGAVAAQCTVYNKPEPSAPWTSQFYWMKGLLITPTDADGAGPQLTRLREEEEVDLRALVYNYSLTAMPDGTLVHVRFYGQEWDGVDPVADAFQIDEVLLDAIPSFNDSNPGSVGEPNWAIAKTSFTPSAAEVDKFLVFWVVVWMEDQAGALVLEMPDHGLTALPGALIDIGQAPIEPYSNNVGLYKQALFVAPKENPEGSSEALPLLAVSGDSEAPELVLENLTVTPGTVTKDARVEVRADLRAIGESVDDISVFFYDGDPDKGGKAFDMETISHIRADEPYPVAVPFRPVECGLHTIFVQAYPVDGLKETLGTVELDVCSPLAPKRLRGIATRVASGRDNGRIRLFGEFPLSEPLNLSTARLTISSLLEEEMTKLVPDVAGLKLVPGPRSTVHRAVFKTADGVRPEVRVEVTMKKNDILDLKLQVKKAAIISPQSCSGMPLTTELMTNVLIEDGRHEPAHIWIVKPWRCIARRDGTIKTLWLKSGNRSLGKFKDLWSRLLRPGLFEPYRAPEAKINTLNPEFYGLDPDG